MAIGTGTKNEKEIWWNRLQLPEVEQGCLPLHISKMITNKGFFFVFCFIFWCLLQPLFFLMTLKSSGQLLCRIFHILKLFDDIFMVSSILSTFYKLWVKSRYLIKIRLCILDKFLSLMSNLLTFPYMFCV